MRIGGPASKVVSVLSLALSLAASAAVLGQVRQAWVATRDLALPAYSTSRPIALQVDGEKSVLMTAILEDRSSPQSHTDYLTIKYDRDGSELWSARYGGAEGRLNLPAAMVVDVQGNVYVTGSSQRCCGPAGELTYDMATVKYDPGGNEVWVAVRRRDDGRPLYASGMALDGQGNLVVVGVAPISESATSVLVIAKYKPDGSEAWVKERDGGFFSRGAPALDQTGNVYLDAQELVKLDPQGIELWARDIERRSPTF